MNDAMVGGNVDIDLPALQGWTDDTGLGLGTLQRLIRFNGGQSNPTYRIDTDAGPIVLRRKPFGKLLPSAHLIEREYRIMSALHSTSVPVPRPVALCEDTGVIGATFYLMELVAGRSLWDGTLPGMDPAQRTAHYDELIEILAGLHRIAPDAVGLEDFGKPGNYVERQVSKWSKQYLQSSIGKVPELDALVEWLPRDIPPQQRTGIVHGDYRIDNVIFDSAGPRILAVLDWELSTLGDPVADYAYFLMNWVMPAEKGRSGLKGADLDSLGIPTLRSAVDRYCALTGVSMDRSLDWYFAYNFFRLAAISHGIAGRVVAGTASSGRSAHHISQTKILARLGWHFARKADG